MKITLKTVIIALCVIVLAVAVLLVIRWIRRDSQIMDGPGMVRDFREYALRGKWTEVCESDPGRLQFDASTLKYKNIWGENGSTGYEVDENDYTGEVRIDFTEGGPFEYLIYHEEEYEGKPLAVISGIIMEYDGRGPVVFNEFVPEADREEVPDDFVSALARSYNDREPIPSYMTVNELYVGELLDCVGWIGKTGSELETADAFVKQDGLFRSVTLNGNLVGGYAYGSAYFDFYDDHDDPVVDRVYLQSEALNFETCKNGLAEHLGEPDGEGEKPYAEVDGGAVTWCTFTTDTAVLDLSSGSERDYIEITIVPKEKQ